MMLVVFKNIFKGLLHSKIYFPSLCCPLFSIVKSAEIHSNFRWGTLKMYNYKQYSKIQYFSVRQGKKLMC